MRNFKLIVAATLLSVGVAKGQDGSFSIEKCREMAIATNYNLKSSQEKVLISQDMLKAYKTNNLPNFSINANYLYSTASLTAVMPGGNLPIFVDNIPSSNSFAYFPDQKFELKAESIYNGGVMVKQPIYMGGKISNAVKLSSLAVDVSKLEVRKTEAEVILLADQAFYKVKEVEEMLIAAEKYLNVVEEFSRQMQSAHNHGMKTRNDLLKVQVRENEAKLMVKKAKNGLRLAEMNLCYVVGLPLTTRNITLHDKELTMDEIVNEELNITSRPEYEMLTQQIKAKELEVKISRSDYMPSLAAIASYNYLAGAKINDSPLFGNAEFSGGISFKLPIFHWGEGKRKVSAKQREITVAENQMKDLSQKMKLELMQSINNFNESLLEEALCNQSVAQSEENMRQSKNQYDAGMETIADYLESQALWQKAMSDLCAAKSKKRIAYTHYQKASGDIK